MNFQTQVYPALPLGIEGDWCSANPRFSKLAGEAIYVAGPNPVTVGRFGWVNPAGQVSNNASGENTLGFIPLRAQVVVIPGYLGGFSMQVEPGYEMTLVDSADVFMRFAAGAAIGQKVFASYADGSAIAGAAGTTIAGAAFTGSVTSEVLTVTAVGSGVLAPGQPIAGGTVTAGTTIIAQLTGTPGGIGTYSTTTTANSTSGSMTSNGALETKWYVDSTAAAGEIAMTSTRS